MSNGKEERDIYYIPGNFLTSGRLFGGMIRVRNAIEACALVLLTGLPIINLGISLTARVIILCLITLPLGVFGVVGIEGDSLSEFVINWFKWLCNRRVLYRSDTPAKQEPEKPSAVLRRSPPEHRPPEQLGITLKQHPMRTKARRPRRHAPPKAATRNRTVQPKRRSRRENTTEDMIPVLDIQNGIVHMKDGRYIKILEVEPINFLLRSVREQKNIIASFASWLKISPVKIQIKVLTKKADISKHLNAIERDMEREQDPKCRELQLDYGFGEDADVVAQCSDGTITVSERRPDGSYHRQEISGAEMREKHLVAYLGGHLRRMGTRAPCRAIVRLITKSM